jgi:cell division GTPase FtsZ
VWWPFSDKKTKQELADIKKHIEQLESDHRSMCLTLQNLQSAIIAISRNNDLVANDVRNIQEMVAHFLSDMDPSQMLFGFSTTDDDSSMN